MRFEKPPKTFEEQVQILQERGMIINDPAKASYYLSHLNYYRLAAYWLPFEQEHTTHRFTQGTSFDIVLQHYLFDRELRLLVMDAIERFEVSFRTRWAYELSLAYGAHAHLNKSLFKQKQYIGNKRCGWNYDDNVNRLKKSVANSSEIFIQHFKKYDEELPPIWVICEIMTFGELSTWYSNLRHGKDRNAIAHAYKLDEVNLTSFLHHLSIVRNLCAHHARLWNRDFTVVWKLPLKTPRGMIENFNSIAKRKIYNTLVMLAYLTDTINPNNSWKKRLFALFMKYENVKASYMGFPDNWCDKPIWQ